MLKKIIIFLGLILLWIFFTDSLNPLNIAVGLLLSVLIYFLFGNYSSSKRHSIKILKILNLIFFFIKELLLANLRVALEVLKPKFDMTPAIISVPLDITRPFQLVIFSGMITLTPGSLTLNFSDDNKTVYIHTLYYSSPEEFRSYIKNGFEKKIMEAF